MEIRRRTTGGSYSGPSLGDSAVPLMKKSLGLRSLLGRESVQHQQLRGCMEDASFNLLLMSVRKP